MARSQTRTSRSRALVIAVALASLVTVLAGCQVSAAGRRCRGTGVAQDATHVLQCRNGRYVRWMTKADGLRLLAAIQAQRGGGGGTPGAPVPTPTPGARATVPAVTAGNPPPPAGSGWGTPGCFDGNDPFTDVWFVGPEDSVGNVRGSSSRNGTCLEGPSGFSLTVVRAPGEAEAAARCAGLGAPSADVFSMPNEAGYAFPVDAWGCR